MRTSGTSFVVGRTQRKGSIPDVRIYTSPTGLSMIEIARDARDLNERSYTIDRRLSGGPWSRLLQVNSFAPDGDPDHISEVRAEVIFEEIPNYWGITPTRSWGLPAGMESPWIEPIEMVGNELLLPEGAKWVSGDAPINQERNNYFENGKYGVGIGGSNIEITNRQTGRLLATLQSNTRGTTWTEGIAGAVLFFGGSIHIEPAKPPILMGTFSLDRDPTYIRPGLYEYGNAFLITSIPISGRVFSGTLAFVDDPFPERWVPRVFCRSYVSLTSPSYVPPLIEEEPQRIGVRVEYVENDFPTIEPKVVTPYADKTGVFNSWEVDTPGVLLAPKNRPYDLLIPFDEVLEDWGGSPVWTPGEFIPTLDRNGEPHASLATEIPYETSTIPEIYEGAIFLRWKESHDFFVFSSDWVDIVYKNGRVFFDNRVASLEGLTGISQPLNPTGSWNDLKIEWGTNYLTVNDVPALTEPRTWGDVLLGDDDTAPELTWGQIANIPEDQWTPNPDLPLDVDQWEEVVPDWVTGNPEWEDEPPDPDYSATPKTWGEVMFVPYGE
jgi:hypothetical protein